MKGISGINDIRPVDRLSRSKSAIHYVPPKPRTGILWAVIPYITEELTRAAVRLAAVSSELDVHISLVDIQVVPFPCSLDQPPIDKKHSQARLLDLLKQSGRPGRVTVSYARDWMEAFERILETRSLVVIATKKRWWPTREKRLASALAKAGHQVLLLPVKR